MEATTRFREAIAAAKAGKRQYAREVLLEIVALEPTNELAWIWLSGLLENREEQIQALENSLVLQEGGDDVVKRLKPIGKGHSAAEVKLYKQAIQQIKAGQRDQGRALLKQLLSANRQHERAWLELSSVAENRIEELMALENVIRINPVNVEARERITTVKHLIYKHHLGLGHQYQQKGELLKAVEAYRMAEEYASSGAFKAAAQQRREILEQRGIDEKATSPSFTAVRLAIGPPVLFLLLVFIQNGLTLLPIDTVYCASGIGVAIGSLILVAATRPKPAPADSLARGQTASRTTQLLLRNIGILFVVVPFVIWLIRVMSG